MAAAGLGGCLPPGEVGAGIAKRQGELGLDLEAARGPESSVGLWRWKQQFADGRYGGVRGAGGIHRAQRAWHKVGAQQVYVKRMKKGNKFCDVVT